MSFKKRIGRATLAAALLLVTLPLMAHMVAQRAFIARAASFTQCPAIAHDSGCAILITINPNGTITIASDGSQGPYDDVEDTLIGVQNNSKVTIPNIMLSAPSVSPPIFGFDGDGLCSGKDGLGIPFTPPAGCPFGSTGYEGPNTSFSGISGDQKSGTVNFTNGGLAPNTSTYFSLEGTFSGESLHVPTTILTYTGPTNQDFNDAVTLSANLTDAFGNPLSSELLSFSFGAESCSGTTDASGNASCTVTPQDAAGPYALTVSFAGDATNNLNPSNAYSTFTVNLEETTLVYTGDTSISQGGSATLSGVLTEDGTTPIAGRTVTFNLGSQSCNGTTDGTGTATCTINPVTVALGNQPVTASFAGDGDYQPAKANATALVYTTTKLTYTTSSATSSDYNDPATLSATLVDNAGGPIPGALITFSLNGTETCNTTTNGTGTASCSVTPGEQAGSYTVVASYAGDATHKPSSASSPFAVTLEEASLSSTTSLQLFAQGHSAALSAVLTDPDGGAPISGKPVVLTLGSGSSAQSCTGTTDATGTASCSINPVTVPLGPQPVTDSFAGDAYYKAATNSQKALVFAYLTSGSFALGDLGISTPPTWWGAQWTKLNSLSGGTAPSAFKGFASTLAPAQLTCGGTWTTTPGNSPPPASSVPSYMAVLVTSNVTQSGSAISGNIKQIVVVNTNAGYQPAPGYPGTGTVVAKVC